MFRLSHEGAQVKLTKPVLDAGETSFACGISFWSSVVSVVDITVNPLEVLLCCSLSTKYEFLDLIEL